MCLHCHFETRATLNCCGFLIAEPAKLNDRVAWTSAVVITFSSQKKLQNYEMSMMIKPMFWFLSEKKEFFARERKLTLRHSHVLALVPRTLALFDKRYRALRKWSNKMSQNLSSKFRILWVSIPFFSVLLNRDMPFKRLLFIDIFTDFGPTWPRDWSDLKHVDQKQTRWYAASCLATTHVQGMCIASNIVSPTWKLSWSHRCFFLFECFFSWHRVLQRSIDDSLAI